MSIKKLFITSSLLISSFAIPHTAIAQNQGTPGQFDFYVLTLSWSPDYCQRKGDRDQQQCGAGKRLGFVLHGLWPQYERGYPANCSSQKLPRKIKLEFPNLYPSDKLYDHEWEKHGTCSGKTPKEYLALSKQLKDAVIVPPAYNRPEKPLRTTTQEFKNLFASANNGLNPDAIAPYCSDSGRFLQEVFFCFSKDGKTGVCSKEILKRSKKSCGQADFLIRSVR